MPIGNLSENGNKNSAVKLTEVKIAISHINMMEGYVFQVRFTGFFFCPTEHLGLDVDGHDVARWANALSDRNAKTAWTTSDIEHLHPQLQVQLLHYDIGPDVLDKRVVKLYKPAKPRRTRQVVVPRRQSPPEKDGEAQSNQAK